MLSDDEKSFICKTLKVNSTALNFLENSGLELGESILYAQAESEYGFSIDRLLKNYPTAESCIGLLTEMGKYISSFNEELIGSQLDVSFREYIFNGFSFEQIRTAYGISQKTDIDMASLLTNDIAEIKTSDNIKTSKKIITDTENGNYERFAEELGVDADSLKKYAEKNELEFSELEKLIENGMEYIIEISSPVDVQDIEGASVSAMSSDTSGGIDKYITAPYTNDYNENEAVNMNTGALVYETVDAVIPGVNDLDLVIGRRYDSSKSNIFDPFVRQELFYDCIYGFNIYLGINGYIVQWLGEGIIDRVPAADYGWMVAFSNHYSQPQFMNTLVYYGFFGPGQDLVYYYYLNTIPYYQTFSGITPDNRIRDLYGLGQGWSFMFSTIEMFEGKMYLHLSDGRTFQINFNANYSNLKDYYLEDLRLVPEYGAYHNGSVYSNYTLYYADGRREFFSGDGKLIGIRDRFDNTINFFNTMVNGLPQIIITDTVGRTINIYGQNLGSAHVMTVVLPDGNTLKYTVYYTSAPEYPLNYGLCKYEDQMMNATNYFYNISAVPLNIRNKNIYEVTNTNFYINLVGITHPTNAQTQYQYTTGYQNLGVSGWQLCFRLNWRADYIGGSEYNRKNYAYSSNGYSGYPACPDPQYLYNGYIYQTTVTEPNGLSKRHTFNYQHLKINESTYSMYETYKIIDFEYNFYKLPIWASEKIFSGGQYSEAITRAQYDIKGRVTASWDAQANGNISNTLNMTTYAYDNLYGLLLSKVYYQNSITRIEERNTLSGNRKTVDSYEVYKNNVSVQKQGFSYDSRGRITSLRNYTTGTSYTETTYGYDSYSNLVSESIGGVKDIDGNYITSPGFSTGTVGKRNSYNVMGKMISETDEKGYTTTYIYNPKGDITDIINPDNTQANPSTTTYYRNYIYNTLMVKNEIGTLIRYDYNQLGYETATIDIATGQTLNIKTYDFLCRLDSEIDVINNNVTKYYYDILSRLVSVSVTQGATKLAEEIYSYSITSDRLTKTVKTKIGDSNAPSVSTSSYKNNMGFEVKTSFFLNGAEYFDTYTYDYLGNKTQSLSAFDSSKGRSFTTRWEYDHAGRITRETNTLNQSSYRSYDMSGRNISVTDHSGNISSFTYDALGKVIKQDTPFELVGGTMYYSSKKLYYDQIGNLTREQTQTNKPGSSATWASVEYAYNNRGFLTNVSNNNNNTAAYTYDTMGNMLTQTTGVSGGTSAVTRYTYDRFGNPLTITDPMGKVERYTYNLVGNVLTKTDRNGWVTTYNYDGLGRMLTQNVNTGNTTQNVLHNWTYTLTGQVRTESNNNFTSTHTYDSLERLTQTSETGGVVKNYSYDIGNNRTSFVTAINSVNRLNTTYTYDELSRLKTVSENGTLQATYAYDTNGNRSSLTCANGIVTTYNYNAANFVTSLQNKLGTAIQSSYSYTYYLNGTNSSKKDHAGRTTTYTYDGMSRLTQEAESGTADAKTYVYTYDNRNNRSSLTVSGSESYSVAYQYDLNDRLTTTTKAIGNTNEKITYQYDNNGNTLSENSNGVVLKQYKYDGLNRQISVENNGTNSSYLYKPDGLRYSKTLNGVITTHIWDDSNIVIDITGSDVVKYIRGINLISSDKNGTKNYCEYNAHGDVVRLSNASGATVQSYHYDAFGVEHLPNKSDSNPFRYCGEYFDLNSNTYYLRARYYDPVTSRMLSEDSVRYVTRKMSNGQEIVDPLSLNLYTYCANNPVMYHDPSGHFWETILDIGGIIWSAIDMVNDPSWENLGLLLWDLGATVVPFVPGSYTAKGAQILIKAGTKVDDVLRITNKYKDALNILSKAGKTLNKGENIFDALLSTKKVGSLRSTMLGLTDNAKLKSIINELWRPTGKIGNGGTADFIRKELKYGLSAGETSHIQKGWNRINELKKVMGSGTLDSEDYQLAYALYQDLLKALNGK